ncbi:MAG: hypothetical protein QOI21_3490 [Actinomycetota bacterium]|nr:hypothetical protein [Actinomycetota bacterium]
MSCAHNWWSPEREMTCLDDLEVVLGCEREPVSVRFAERHVAAPERDRRLFFLVELRAPGLEARAEGVTNFIVGTGLARFLDSLDFRGWKGKRRWANSNRDLRVSAVFESGGHIALTWKLAPWRSYAAGWDATVTTRLEAGAQKDTLAADLREFMAAEAFGVDYYEGDITTFE